MTLETRNAKREEAIRSLQDIARYAELIKQADEMDEREIWVARMGREQAKVRRLAEEMSCE